MRVKRTAIALALSCFALQPATAGCFEGFISPEIEAAAIATSDGKARRTGRDLHLQAESGDVIVSNTECEDDAAHCISYAFAGSSPNGDYHVLQVQLYEGRNAALVGRRDGALTWLAGFPDWSPDGDRLYSAFFDSHFADIAFEIWNVTGEPHREYLLEPEDRITYCVARWLGPEEILLKKTLWTSHEFSVDFIESVSEARLTMLDGEWSLYERD
ncbi:MAG: hypothetical protein KF895_09630 [Parvibaculum sp.]|nr:hypothetical protein [Parvibaculum sp.]